MTRTLLLATALLTATGVSLPAQDIPAEYRVKAAYLYNFVKFVEWPASESSAPLMICVAGRNPFGTLLENLVRGELVRGRRIMTALVLDSESDCDVMFVPEGSPTGAYLRTVRGMPVLTVGETADFIAQGGIARFYLSRGHVRFEINPAEAERAGLRISSRLLELARIAGAREGRP